MKLSLSGELFVASRKRKDVPGGDHELNTHLERVSRLVGLGELAGALSHELRNGLAAIQQFASGIKHLDSRGHLTLDHCRDCLRDIQDQTEHLTDVLTTIHNLIKNRSGKPVQVDLCGVLRQAERLIAAKLCEKHVTLEFVEPAKLPPVRADPGHILVVAVNLMLNAVQAMATLDNAKRRLILSLSRHGNDAVEVSFRDHGPGLPPDQLEKVFEKFYTTKEEGLGLGLTFSRFYVEQNGGRLWCTSQPGEGCDFRFTLPRA